MCINESAMKKVLIVCFEPFGGELRNPAWDVLSTFKYNSRDDVILSNIVLPCTFSDSKSIILGRLNKEDYDAIIIFAQAGGRWDINLERLSINFIDSPIPDNNGIKIVDDEVETEGPSAYFSTLPIKKIVKQLRDNNIPASVSNNAGTFLCNYIFYTLLHHAAESKRKTSIGVVHIPYTPEQVVYRPGVPYMSEEVIVKALVHIITNCIS